MKLLKQFYAQTEPQATRREKKPPKRHHVRGLSKACKDLKCHKCTSQYCEHECHDDEK